MGLALPELVAGALLLALAMVLVYRLAMQHGPAIASSGAVAAVPIFGALYYLEALDKGAALALAAALGHQALARWKRHGAAPPPPEPLPEDATTVPAPPAEAGPAGVMDRRGEPTIKIDRGDLYRQAEE